ncbi:glycosyltransferase family 4 protein [Sphingobium mellinum]|uniref:glycosyltransferase family 4 protein n=1 Tax=Sphingobium mellinum TaxID=1387166 RepID=UPI0030ECD555
MRPVTQVALGRFHHFHLARQLERRGRLAAIWSGYPRFKLKDEGGISPDRIRSFPWFYVPAQAAPRLPVIGSSSWLRRSMHWQAVEAIDRRVAASLDAPTILVGLSSGGLHAGRRAQALGGAHVCDRGSTHIRFQDAILQEEYARWDIPYQPIDPRVVAKEEAEYANADRITIPSQFCFQTFIDAGVPADRLRVIPYGGRLDRFAPAGEPDRNAFTVLFVGNVTIRKGIAYLLQAFAALPHPAKRLKVIGAVDPEVAPLLRTLPLDCVEFLGAVPNTALAGHYSSADVMVLPSLEEGLALVMAEAMACGCPVIASANSGARNLFTDGVEGRIVPAGSTPALLDAMQDMAQDRVAALEMRHRARQRIESLGGYDRYGEQWADLLAELDGAPSLAHQAAA